MFLVHLFIFRSVNQNDKNSLNLKKLESLKKELDSINKKLSSVSLEGKKIVDIELKRLQKNKEFINKEITALKLELDPDIIA